MTINGLHIEPTNICTLKCPRCARTKFLETFKQKNWQNYNLNLQDLKNFLDIPLVNIQVSLCGNYGDPIYYPDLFSLINFFKTNGSIIQITTNGSYKDTQWWNELVTNLDSNDTITFSVDGTPDNFTNYRINADWPSILNGMKIVAHSHVKSNWKYIPFKFNENSIQTAKKLSEDIGIKQFIINPSDRWDSDNDYLKPTNIDFHGPRNKSIIEWKYNKNYTQSIEPKCQDNKQHFITSTGYYAPCCYVNDYRFYYKSKFFKEKNFYDIRTNTITRIIENEQNFFNRIEEDKPFFCTFNCAKTEK